MQLVIFPVFIKPAPTAAYDEHTQTTFLASSIEQIADMFQHVVNVPALLFRDNIAVPKIGSTFGLSTD